MNVITRRIAAAATPIKIALGAATVSHADIDLGNAGASTWIHHHHR